MLFRVIHSEDSAHSAITGRVQMLSMTTISSTSTNSSGACGLLPTSNVEFSTEHISSPKVDPQENGTLRHDKGIVLVVEVVFSNCQPIGDKTIM